MSKDTADLKDRIGKIIVGLSPEGKPVTAKDLKADGAMAAILKDAMMPNVVQTLEGNPVFVHGGPFANIAQGTSSISQTQLCRKVADVVITEAGFAFDLGGFKFVDLKCRNAGFKPAAVVLVVTVRALRHHGGVDHAAGPNIDAVKSGFSNVAAHMAAMKRLGLPKVLVSINRFPDDSAEELALVKSMVTEHGGSAVEGEYFAKGGDGALELADALMAALEENPTDSPDFKAPYELSATPADKVAGIAKTVLGASGVELTDNAKADHALIEKMGVADLPVCLAKTHLSISDNKKVQGDPGAFTLKVTGFRPSAGAGFVVALCGPVLTMPGLPKVPAAKDVDIERQADGTYSIVGLR